MLKTNKNLIIIVIVISILVLGLTGYLIYDNFYNKENDNNSLPKMTTTSTTTPINTNQVSIVGTWIFDNLFDTSTSLVNLIEINDINHPVLDIITIGSDYVLTIQYETVGINKEIVGDLVKVSDNHWQYTDSDKNYDLEYNSETEILEMTSSGYPNELYHFKK